MEALQTQEQQKKELLTLCDFATAKKAKLNDCIEARSLKKFIKVAGSDMVEVTIIAVMSNFLKLFNVKYTMNDLQISVFAERFIEEYEHESIEDLIVCLKSASVGSFGEINHTIDSPIVFKWFRMHLDNKYIKKEQILQKKKKLHLKESKENPINHQLNKEWSQKIREGLKNKEDEPRKGEGLGQRLKKRFN